MAIFRHWRSFAILSVSPIWDSPLYFRSASMNMALHQSTPVMGCLEHHLSTFLGKVSRRGKGSMNHCGENLWRAMNANRPQKNGICKTAEHEHVVSTISTDMMRVVLQGLTPSCLHRYSTDATMPLWRNW